MGSRLLLVEDEATLSRALSRLLRRHGYEISLASSAAAARKVEGPFLLGIFDIDLPDGDGVALAEELLKKGVVERAVFFSGTRDGEQQRRAERVAMLVDKGDGFPQLMATIARAAESQRARVAGAEDAPFEQSGGPPPSGVRDNGEHESPEPGDTEEE
jgi:DNA-binding NtrC family response regulator